MNHNDLDLSMTNLAISQTNYKAETKFHNSEIVILEKYTIDTINYDADKGEIHFTLKEREDTNEEEARWTHPDNSGSNKVSVP